MTHSDEPWADVDLRLVWPQWQGGGTVSVQQLASESRSTSAAVGTRSARRSSKGPAAARRLDGDRTGLHDRRGLEERDGVEAKAMVVEQLGERPRRHPSLQPGADCDPRRLHADPQGLSAHRRRHRRRLTAGRRGKPAPKVRCLRRRAFR